MIYQIRSLETGDIPAMHNGFLKGFSDYKVPFKLNREAFVKKFVEKLHLDFSLSVGVFHQNELVGFIFHTINTYQGRKTIYNGGTGVSPEHRGNRLVKEMYKHIYPAILESGVDCSVLEVLTDNEKAIKAYLSVGFEKGALLRCFKLNELDTAHANETVVIRPQRKFQPGKYNYMEQALPSFQDVNEHIIHDRANETLLEAKIDEKVVGYIIFHSASGRISQLAVDRSYQNQGIGSRLLREAHWLLKGQPMTVINLRAEELETAEFLINRGFVNEVDQYEMVMEAETIKGIVGSQ